MPFDNAQRPGPGRGTGERAINLPPAVLWLIGINLAVHVLRSLLSDEADSAIILQFGLIPANYTGGGHDLVSQVLAPITGSVEPGKNTIWTTPATMPAER